MSDYVMLGITSEGKAEYIQESTSANTLIASASRAVENGNTGGYVAIDVVRIVCHFPIPNPSRTG